jgi:20S proteasome alpha/beta subunit
MTIALGVLARDGVVLAADSEVTWGYLKTSGEKIRSAEGRNGALAIAGSWRRRLFCRD